MKRFIRKILGWSLFFAVLPIALPAVWVKSMADPIVKAMDWLVVKLEAWMESQ